jgi:hypothetical protein
MSLTCIWSSYEQTISIIPLSSTRMKKGRSHSVDVNFSFDDKSIALSDKQKGEEKAQTCEIAWFRQLRPWDETAPTSQGYNLVPRKQ